MAYKDIPSPFETDLLEDMNEGYPIGDEEEDEQTRDEVYPRRVPSENFDLL